MCVYTCVWNVIVFQCVKANLDYALLSNDKYSPFLDVAWRTPASDSCRPQQWDQDCFGDIQWQQCLDTEHGLKHELTQADRTQCNRCRNGLVGDFTQLKFIFHGACFPMLVHNLLKHTYPVAKLMIDALWIGAIYGKAVHQCSLEDREQIGRFIGREDKWTSS